MSKYTKQYTQGSLKVLGSIVNFIEVEKEHNVVLYEGTSEAGTKQYEIHVLEYGDAHPDSADEGKRFPMSPSTSMWGSFGFTYQSYEKAMERYHQLVDTNSRKHRFLAERDAIHASQADSGNITPESTTRSHTVDALAHIFPSPHLGV